MNFILTIIIFIILLRVLESLSYIKLTFHGHFFQEITKDNPSLVFIKPENLTKTELVEKFKELSSSKSLKDLKNNKDKNEDKITTKELLNSYFLRLLAFILKFKNLITKIALFSILIKYFRKIKIMKITFRIINYIFLSTFGIFITDIYGLKEIIAQIEYYWMEYVNFIHESKIYKLFVKISHLVIDENKAEVIENKAEVIENKSEVIENKSESNIYNSEFPSSGRELKNEKIVHDKTSERNERENWFELKTYFLLGISFITLGIIYIYWDSISELFKKPDLGGGDEGSNITETPIFLDPQEEYEKYFREISTNQELYDLEVIRSQNKERTIDYSEVEKEKWGDSPTTPKASTSNLPLNTSSDPGVMLPISKK